MAARAPTNRHVALLRGINLGNRRIPMPELAALFADAGCADVATYIASGNVVFTAAPALAKRIADVIPAAITAGYGFDAPIVVRSAAELESLVRANPFLKRGPDPNALHVSFLARVPSRAALASLDPDRSRPDEFLVRGADIYLHLPNGMARTKLTNAYFDSTLGTVSTARNWRTVLALLEMARGGGSEGKRGADTKRARR